MVYPYACKFAKKDETHHHLHSFHNEKSIIDRTVQYIKDRIEGFDDHFHVEEKRTIN
jgi:putative transposase